MGRIIVDGGTATYRFADAALNEEIRRDNFRNRRAALRSVPAAERHAYANTMRVGPFVAMMLPHILQRMAVESAITGG